MVGDGQMLWSWQQVKGQKDLMVVTIAIGLLPHGEVERNGSGVELQTLEYENPGSNPGC